MSSTEYKHSNGDEYITELTHTDTQTAKTVGHIPCRHINVSISDGQLFNNNTDIETVSIRVMDGLEVARGADLENATVLDYGGDVTLSIDGVETTKTLTDGSVSFDLTTDKPAGSTIKIVAESLADHPAETDSATIEVVSQ